MKINDTFNLNAVIIFISTVTTHIYIYVIFGNIKHLKEEEFLNGEIFFEQ